MIVTNAVAVLVKAANQSVQALKCGGTSARTAWACLDQGTAVTGRQYFWKVALLSENCMWNNTFRAPNSIQK